MLFYIYSDSPSSTIDITSRCRVGRLSIKDQAEEGSVAMSSLIIDDEAGTLEITGHRRMYIYESDAPILDQVIYNGFVVNEREERGPYRTGAGSQWLVDLADNNVLINRRIFQGADANRPAETDLARIQALFGMTEFNTVDDDTYVNATAATTAMDAVDYRNQTVGAYIDDCRQASGKNAFILYNETLGQYGLWYDFADSTAYDSACFLTNTAAEANHSTVFLYSQERTYLNHDPSRIASGVLLEFDGPGSPVYVLDDPTVDAFAAIDWSAPSLNVKSEAKALARAQRYQADARTEQDIIHTVMTKVPRAMVNKIKKGHLVSFKATWMSAYTSYTVCRVLHRTVTEISEDPQASFEIELELSPVEAGEAPFAIMYAAHSPGTAPPAGTPNHIYFGGSGDDPPAGYPPNPTVGMVTIDLSGFSPPEKYVSFTVTGTGTIDMTLHSTVAGVPLVGDVYSVDIWLNGLAVGSDSIGPCVINFFWPLPNEIDIAVTGLSVVPGDLIEVVEHSAPRTGFFAPAGAGDTTVNFTITGGNLV